MTKSLKISQKLIDAVEREACKKSFFEFVQSFWDVVIKEKPIYNWHIPYLCNELQILAHYIVNRLPKPYDLIINIPPGSSKSTIVTQMFPAWIWTVDPTIRIISNSYSGDLSTEHSVKCRDIILSPKYQRLFSDVKLRKDKSGKQLFENTKGGARYSTSTGGTITGIHAHVILNDDPINPKQAVNEQARETANEHTKTLASRRVEKENTPTILVMQRLHEMDVTGFLLKQNSQNIKHICLPAELSEHVKPVELREKYVDGLLDPIRMSRNALSLMKVALGSKGYANQFDQAPTADEGNIVKKEWFGRIDYSEFDRLRTSEPIIFFVDTAYTEKKINDPTGIIATCKIKNILYIVHAEKKLLEFPELIKWLPSYAMNHGYGRGSSIRIEPKASGKSVVQMLQRSTTLSVLETPVPKDSKEVRLTAVSPKIEARRVVLVDGSWNDEFIEEVSGFPAREHDEYVDILGYAIDYHLPDLKQNNNARRIAQLL